MLYITVIIIFGSIYLLITSPYEIYRWTIGLIGIIPSIFLLAGTYANITGSFKMHNRSYEITKEKVLIECKEYTKYEEKHLGAQIDKFNEDLNFYKKLNQVFLLDSIVLDSITELKQINRLSSECR